MRLLYAVITDLDRRYHRTPLILHDQSNHYFNPPTSSI